MAQRGSMHLQMLLPEDWQSEVDFLHAFQETRAKCKVLMEFCQRVINILCATEAAGMVCISRFFSSLWLIPWSPGHGHTWRWTSSTVCHISFTLSVKPACWTCRAFWTARIGHPSRRTISFSDCEEKEETRREKEGKDSECHRRDFRLEKLSQEYCWP